MSSIETPRSSSSESFQDIIYTGSALPLKSDVLLLRSRSGQYTLPESEIDPRINESGFKRDIHEATGLDTAPFMDSFKDSVRKYWPEAADAHKIVLPYQRTTHYVLSRVVGGDLSVNSHYSDAKWVDILHLPNPEDIDPFSLVSLKRLQVSWALANTY